MKRYKTNSRLDKRIFRMTAIRSKRLNDEVLMFRGGIRL